MKPEPVPITDTASVVWAERRSEPWGPGWIVRYVKDGKLVEAVLPAAIDPARPYLAVQDGRITLIRAGVLLPDYYLAGRSWRAPRASTQFRLHAIDPCHQGYGARGVCGVTLRSFGDGRFHPEDQRTCRACRAEIRKRERRTN